MVKKYIRKLIPNHAVNLGKHLPMAVLANLKYGFPSRGIKVIGVTGTDGKTTTCNMIFEILKRAGKSVSMISTINAQIGDKKYDTGFHVTTPTHMGMQRYIKEARDAGSEYLVLEVTSFALAQYRTWGVKFDIGIITNITHEHLDYHKSFENYLLAKAKLIRDVRVAILNKGEKHLERLKKLTSGKVVSFGLTKEANFNPTKFPFRLGILGEYNKLNGLAAAAAAVNLGIPTKIIKESLENFKSLSGRMEEVENDRGIKIFVDFAHTPNALEEALRALKRDVPARGEVRQGGRVIAVFGSASERDREKRPLMGKVSGKLADITILTDEDPRFESSEKIIEEISKGAVGDGAREGENLFKEPNREKAIAMAINLSKKGDVVGIFGKGHERSMNYKGVEKPWSDIEVVKKVLKG